MSINDLEEAMSMETAMVSAARPSSRDLLGAYIDLLGGVAVVADWLEVPRVQVQAWLAGTEPVPVHVVFWLDDAAGQLPAEDADW
ncbi:hypothetical protein [Krasilnikovia sp. MM14-A1259]|uniref:hypothetical protein n=1 Tax=Krasilnikovia sp. MM14-A1259 TaxID=3373539 RepID=UPI00399CA2D4